MCQRGRGGIFLLRQVAPRYDLWDQSLFKGAGREAGKRLLEGHGARDDERCCLYRWIAGCVEAVWSSAGGASAGVVEWRRNLARCGNLSVRYSRSFEDELGQARFRSGRMNNGMNLGMKFGLPVGARSENYGVGITEGVCCWRAQGAGVYDDETGMGQTASTGGARVLQLSVMSQCERG